MPKSPVKPAYGKNTTSTGRNERHSSKAKHQTKNRNRKGRESRGSKKALKHTIGNRTHIQRACTGEGVLFREKVMVKNQGREINEGRKPGKVGRWQGVGGRSC